MSMIDNGYAFVALFADDGLWNSGGMRWRKRIF